MGLGKTLQTVAFLHTLSRRRARSLDAGAGPSLAAVQSGGDGGGGGGGGGGSSGGGGGGDVDRTDGDRGKGAERGGRLAGTDGKGKGPEQQTGAAKEAAPEVRRCRLNQ